jgi:nicotinate-nucleotide adenylyltransferase
MHATGISRVIVTPTYSHALQKGTKTSFEHRLRMTQLAMSHLTGVEVSPIEADLGGTSRTYRTLEALATQNPSHRIYLVIGADILEETHRWYRWDDITSMATPFVVGRAGYPSPPHCPFDLPEISSTAIRGRLAGSLDTQGLLAPQVAHSISAHGLYRDEA